MTFSVASDYAENFSNGTNTVQLFFLIDYADCSIRVLAVLVHILYFCLIPFLKEYRTRTSLCLHNINLVSMLYCIHYVFYINSKYLTYKEQRLDIICRISEFFWMIFSFARLYSVLALAIYRYAAVYCIHLFKRINKSTKKVILMVSVPWLVSCLFSAILKFSLGTSYSKWYCTDGFSEDMNNFIFYYILKLFLTSILPSIAIFVLYRKILTKMKQLSEKFRQNKTGKRNSEIFILQENLIIPRSSSLHSRRRPNSSMSIWFKYLFFTNRVHVEQNSYGMSSTKKQKNLAKQIFLLNIFSIFNSLFSLVVSIQLILISHPRFFYIYYTLRDMRYSFRMSFLVIQTATPIISLVLYPGKLNLIGTKNFLKRPNKIS